MMSFRTLSILAALITLPNLGCPPATPPLDTLDNLPDADGDGFGDLDAPEGVDTTETIAVAVINSITRDAMLALVGDQAPTQLLSLLTIVVRQDITRVYGDQRITDTDSRTLGAFELRVEAPCPDEVIVDVGVVASAPLVGTVFDQNIAEFTASQTPGAGALTFECGNLITVEAMLDESGQPTANISIEPR